VGAFRCRAGPAGSAADSRDDGSSSLLRCAFFLPLAYTAPLDGHKSHRYGNESFISEAFAHYLAHILLLSRRCDAYAAGPYDGEWTGWATSTGGGCKPAIDLAAIGPGTSVLGAQRRTSATRDFLRI
jgi:hypothetical protein